MGISHADAEDAVQETAYKYLLYYDTIHTTKIRSWLIRVALNFYYDQCRKQKRCDNNTEALLKMIDFGDLPETIFLVKERNQYLRMTLNKLKPHFRELLLLKYQSNLSYEEISELLDITVSSVKTNLFRARKKFAEVYKEESYER